jgi:hypothetical protein
MTNGSFSLEDKLTFEELAPSLQDMFKIMNVGTLLTDLLENGTNGRNVKIDSDNTLLFEDDDFRTAKITNNQIMISDIDMKDWQIATAATESSPATQVIPNRIFLYDVSSTNLWFYQDWDHKWCIRKDTSVDATKAQPGDIIKLDKDVKVSFDPNYRFKRMVANINQLYKEVRVNPTDYIYTDNDYNIYMATANVYYTPKPGNVYPLAPSKTVEKDIDIGVDPYGVNGEEFPILSIKGSIKLNGTNTIDAMNILSTDANLSAISNPEYYVLKFTNITPSGSGYKYTYKLCAYKSGTLTESANSYNITLSEHLHNISTYRAITGVGIEYSSEYINIDPNYNANFYNNYVKNSMLKGEYANIEIGGTLLADGFNYSNYQADFNLGTVQTIPTYQIRADEWTLPGDGISIVGTGITNTYNVINTVNGIPTTLYSNLKLGYDGSSMRYMVLWIRLKYKESETHVFTDQEMVDEYYDLADEKAHTKLTSRTWYYNEGIDTLFFYKYAKKAYVINSDVVN